MNGRNFRPNSEFAGLAEQDTYFNNFLTENNGKTALLFKNRLGTIHEWLLKNKKYFTQYKIAEKAFEELASIEKRKPESDHLTLLSLDISPEVGQAIKKLRSAKQSFYEAIRSADAFSHQGSKNRLLLEKDERLKIINQINSLRSHLNIQVPDLNTLLFPDSSFSISAEDLNDPHKKIDYPFLDYLFAISHMLVKIDIRIKSQKYTKGKS